MPLSFWGAVKEDCPIWCYVFVGATLNRASQARFLHLAGPLFKCGLQVSAQRLEDELVDDLHRLHAFLLATAQKLVLELFLVVYCVLV